MLLLGPALVPDKNLTNFSQQDVRNKIQLYMGIDAGVAVALMIAVICYFPAKPPTPPSASASVPRTNFMEGLKSIIKNPNVLLCTFGYAVSGGINGAWSVSV